MKEYTIILTKAEIFENVSLHSTYTGAKNTTEDTSLMKVATNDSDNLMLSRFWLDICGEITEKFRQFIVKTEINDTSFSMTLELSSAFDESLLSTIRTDLQGACVNGILGAWFEISFPEKSVEAATRCQTLLQRAFSKLCHRRKPIRPSGMGF